MYYTIIFESFKGWYSKPVTVYLKTMQLLTAFGRYNTVISSLGHVTGPVYNRLIRVSEDKLSPHDDDINIMFCHHGHSETASYAT